MEKYKEKVKDNDKEKVKEKIARWKLLAEQHRDNGIPTFIKEINGDFHFCEVVIVGEERITVDNYGPLKRAGKRDYINWLQIEEFDRDRKKEKLGNSELNGAYFKG